MRFRDRLDAGARLADRLASEDLQRPLVLALPRGGLPVAFQVARRLDAPLEVFVARKIGAPRQPELGIGAIAEGGTIVLREHLRDALGITGDQLDELRHREEHELERRITRYRGGRALPEVRDRDVLLVDDGVATGVTAEAALRSLRGRDPRRLILAVPVCAPDTARRLGALADVVCVVAPPEFQAVGTWYEDFTQTSDEIVLDLLARASAGSGAGDRR